MSNVGQNPNTNNPYNAEIRRNSKNGQNRSHSTHQITNDPQNNQNTQSQKEKNFNKSHGKLPSTDNTSSSINQPNLINKGSILVNSQ